MYFREKQHINYDSKKQRAISDKFKELIESLDQKNKGLFTKLFNNRSVQKYETKNLWVILRSFERIAKIEANQRIPQEKINKLKIKINNAELWETSGLRDSLDIFSLKNGSGK